MASLFEAAVSKINKDYKAQLIQKGTERVYVEKIPFTSPRANYMTYGGVPIGKATEFFGPEGGGKTTSALIILGQAQKKAKREFNAKVANLTKIIEEMEKRDNKSEASALKKKREELTALLELGPRKCVLVDLENTLDEDWAQMNGVDLTELWLLKCFEQTGEQVLQIMLDLLETGECEIMVLDSIPMLIPQKLYEKTMEDKAYAGISDAMTTFSAKASPLISRHHTALILINQVREDLDNPYNLYKTPGGRALKHLYSLRIYFQKGAFLDAQNKEIPNSHVLRVENPISPDGNLVNMKIIKTKVCRPNRLSGQYTLKYEIGVDIVTDTLEMAIQFRMINLSGAWHQFIAPDTGEILQMPSEDDPDKMVDMKFNGRSATIEFLKNDEMVFQELYDAVMDKLKEEQ